jgi:hypothetical protein
MDRTWPSSRRRLKRGLRFKSHTVFDTKDQTCTILARVLSWGARSHPLHKSFCGPLWTAPGTRDDYHQDGGGIQETLFHRAMATNLQGPRKLPTFTSTTFAAPRSRCWRRRAAPSPRCVDHCGAHRTSSTSTSPGRASWPRAPQRNLRTSWKQNLQNEAPE